MQPSQHMQITITINTDNAAFEDGNSGNEVARILHARATALEGADIKSGDATRLRDINGNVVGLYAVTD